MSPDGIATTAGRVDIGKPALLAMRGPDAERFLNGQITQDVRRLADTSVTLPSCVTDAKGRLQFRVWLTRADDGALWIEGPAGSDGPLEERLTRYLIADDVEVENLSGSWRLTHFIGGDAPPPPASGFARKCVRFGVPGTDCWTPAAQAVDFSGESPLLHGDALEDFRIRHGVPAWGRELRGGLLVPETGLESSDISYQKGCYIGQEVISRIKYAGKVNQRLIRLRIDGAPPRIDPDAPPVLEDEDGKSAGFLTSISPVADAGGCAALGYLRRGVSSAFLRMADGSRREVRGGAGDA